MSRRRDLFARVSLDYADHPKIAGLSDAAFRAHVEMILYSRRYMTDGAIAKQIAKRWPEHALQELLHNDSNEPSLKLDETGTYILHGFCDMQETREEIERKARVRAEAGRKGGLAGTKQPAKRKRSNLLSKNEAETETETETELTPSMCSPAASNEVAVEVASRFDEFWWAYPRKANKKKAREVYAKAAKRTSEATIIAGAESYRDDPNREDAYTKLPTTWLNGECWEDPPLPPRGMRTNAQDRRAQQVVDLVARNLPDPNQDPRGEVEP